MITIVEEQSNQDCHAVQLFLQNPKLGTTNHLKFWSRPPLYLKTELQKDQMKLEKDSKMEQFPL